MTPDDFAAFADATEAIVAIVAGYRAQMESAGFSPTAAEEMAVDYHAMLMAKTATSGAAE